MAAETERVTQKMPGETLSDRGIMLHLLQHMEHLDAVIEEMAGKVTAMHAELEAARPLLERAKRPGGRLGMLGGWP